MKNILFLLFAFVMLAGCRRDFDVVIPDTSWALFDDPAATPLSPATRPRIEGVYTVTQGADNFGPQAVARWSYTVTGTDTVYHLSFFCERDIAYIICEGRRRDTSILLKGYWRKMVNSETGPVQLTVGPSGGANYLLGTAAFDTVQLTGIFRRDLLTASPLVLRFNRPLKQNNGFEIVAHRGGGRTADLLPAAENSTEMIRMASRFGATGIEIDVRLTKDGVPVLFHDATLNERVIIKNGMVGPIGDYTYAQLEALVRLQRGGRIPTLREALTAVVYETPLRYVWLDTKFSGPLQVLRDIQAEFMQKAAALGKPLLITIGIPDEEVLGQFKMLNNYQNIPSVCELSTNDVVSVNARIWAPQWTLGLQNEAATVMQSQGRRVFTWTLDVPANVNEFMTQGRFNGILSNYPSIVAYFYYANP